MDRDIQRCTLSWAFAALVACPGARPERVLMKRDEKNIAVLVENVLRPIAMMYIEIDDGKPADLVMFLKIAGCNRDIGKKAKPHCPVRQCVMPRRSHRTKGVVRLTGHDRVRCGQGRADS